MQQAAVQTVRVGLLSSISWSGGTLVVLGGAGTGKSHSAAARTAQLVRSGQLQASEAVLLVSLIEN